MRQLCRVSGCRGRRCRRGEHGPYGLPGEPEGLTYVVPRCRWSPVAASPSVVDPDICQTDLERSHFAPKHESPREQSFCKLRLEVGRSCEQASNHVLSSFVVLGLAIEANDLSAGHVKPLIRISFPYRRSSFEKVLLSESALQRCLALAQRNKNEWGVMENEAAPEGPQRNEGNASARIRRLGVRRWRWRRR